MADEWDVIVVGAGPAGLAAALYSARAMMKTLAVEKSVVGGQLSEACDVDNYPGFDQGIMGGELVNKMKAHAERFGATIEAEAVEGITADGHLKTVHTDAGDHRAPIVIIASGAQRRKLEVEGEERLAGVGVSYCATCDGAFFRDKRLVVVGGGDAALTEMMFLTRFASEIKLVHRRQGFRAGAVHVREAQEHEKVEFVLDTVVREITGDKKVDGVAIENVQTGQVGRIDCEGVFVFVGQMPNTGYLKTILPECAGGVVPADMNMATEVKGLYAVGDARKGAYRQVATAVSDGVTAAMHAAEHIEALRAER